MFVPLTIMLAPGKGIPASSSTLPLICFWIRDNLIVVLSLATFTVALFSNKVTVLVDSAADTCMVKGIKNKGVNLITFPNFGVSQ